MAEKTEKPTSKRRKDSAKKGQTFKNKDLITTFVLLLGAYYLVYMADFDKFKKFYFQVLINPLAMGIGYFLAELAYVFFQLTLPFIALCSVTGLALTLIQTRFTIATEALKINFMALNPVQGIKKIFSLRTVKEFVKSIIYLIVLVLTCYTLVNNELYRVLTLYRADITSLCTIWLKIALKSMLIFMGWAIFVLLADFIVEYFLHTKDIKMDKHEVKRERRESDGNPQIKSARRRVRQEILSGEEMAAVRNSSVIMANPTHIAIAIYFNPEVASLPFIALRSTNQKAKAAIAYAEKLGIPVVRNITLTRQLYHSYSQYSFISINDELLIDIMDILIWLRQVEAVEQDKRGAEDVKETSV